MISKELLIKILKIRCKIVKMEPYKNEIWWWEDLDGECSDRLEINIYELAHKCKEWAYVNCCVITSVVGAFTTVRLAQYPLENFVADTEPEAIFKACQWILDEKSKSE